MKIKHLKVDNFMGYQGVTEFDMPRIAALVGHNGIGKTSILNAIRYALTGEEPSGDIINHSADTCKVEITLTDPVDDSDIVFGRAKSRTKPSKFTVDGAKTTAAKLNEKISDVCGIALDKIKILSSAEVVSNMKPQEFSKFIMDYIPEKIDIRFVIDNLDRTTPEILDTIDANLPPSDIDMDVIDEFLDSLKFTRKELKTRIAEKKALLGTKPEEPVGNKEELEAQMSCYNEILKKKEVIEAKRKAYEKSIENRKKQEAQLKTLKAEIDTITATRVDPYVREKLSEEREEYIKLLENKKIELNGFMSALTQLQNTLDALNKPICPISPLITCHTDKSVAKEDISESIEATKTGISALEEDTEKFNVKLAEIDDKIVAFDKQRNDYQRKLNLAKMIKSIEDNLIEVPDIPDVENSDISEVAVQMEECKKMLSNIREYEEGVSIKGELNILENQLYTTEYLVSALSDKGCVRTAIIKRYVGVFEELLNERSGKIRDDIKFAIVPEDGIKILMDTGNGMLPYNNLSGGEQAYMLFMVMDMLNALSGTRILFIDELSVMDAENFNSLMDIITMYQEEYDHVIFAAVDHKETVASVRKHDIPMVGLNEGLKTTAA